MRFEGDLQVIGMTLCQLDHVVGHHQEVRAGEDGAVVGQGAMGRPDKAAACVGLVEPGGIVGGTDDRGTDGGRGGGV